MNSDALEKVVEEEFAGRAEAILEEARAKAAEIETRAAANAEAVRTESQQRREKRAGEDANRVLNRARVEAERAVSRIRGTFVTEVVAGIEKEMETSARNGKMHDALERLVAEAVQTFAVAAKEADLDDQVVVQVSPGLEAAAKREASSHSLQAEVSVENNGSAGIRIADRARRVQVTNTLASRLARGREGLVEMIAAAFTGKE